MATLQVHATAELDDSYDSPAAVVEFILSAGALHVSFSLTQLWLEPEAADSARGLLAFLENRADEYLADTEDYVRIYRRDGFVHFASGGEEPDGDDSVSALAAIYLPEVDCAAMLATAASQLRALGLKP